MLPVRGGIPYGRSLSWVRLRKAAIPAHWNGTVTVIGRPVQVEQEQTKY